MQGALRTYVEAARLWSCLHLFFLCKSFNNYLDYILAIHYMTTSTCIVVRFGNQEKALGQVLLFIKHSSNYVT